MAGHNELLDALEAIGATERERLANAVVKAHQLMSGSTPGVAAPGVIRAKATLPRPTTANTDAPVAGTGFLANPSAHGYPDATNTGYRGSLADLLPVGNLDVRPGDIRQNGVVVATRPASGSTIWGPVTLYPDRTDITRMNMNGMVTHTSSLAVNVVDSVLTRPAGVTSGRVWQNLGMGWDGPRVTFTDCTFNARSCLANVGGHHMTFIRCDIQGGEDLVDVSHQITFDFCYLHDPVRVTPDAHMDAFQMGSGSAMLVKRCTIKCTNGADLGNAVLMIGNYAGDVWDVTFDDCLCDGGNYTFNANWSGVGAVNGPFTVRNCRVGRHFRYGYVAGDFAAEATWENNVDDDTGAPV